MGIGYRLDGLGTGRVNHGDQPQEDEVLLRIQGRGFPGGQLPVGKGQHPLSLIGKRLVHLSNLPADFVRHGNQTMAGEQVSGTLQQHIHGALGQQGGDTFNVVEGTHELPVGVKGQLSQPGVLVPVVLLNHPELLCQHHQGHLRGVADGGALLLVMGGIAG